jgi:ABC-type Fe3+-hydroxamate transport system substrate-binding protein
MVLQRSPIFIVGRGSFIDEMLVAAGATNLGAGFDEPYPRVGAEWLVAAAPEVLLDMSPDPEDAHGFWSRWPTIPAVSNGRVQRLDPEQVTLPGPHLDRALETLAAALYGDAVRAELAAERAGPPGDAAAASP